MSRKRGVNLATTEGLYEPYEVAARLHLRKWASEMKRGNGQPNVLEWFGQARDRQTGAWPMGPGPGFSAPAERADQALRMLREMHPNFAVTLIAWAIDVSLAPTRTKEEKAAAEEQLGRGLTAFAMALHAVRYLQVAQSAR